MTLQHLRSSTANKRPDPTAMADGQIALNTAAASPGLFYKDSAGNLVKAGPVHVGSTAPNVSPASGGTAGNSTGESWLDTSGSNPLLKIWSGAAWQTVQPVASGTVVSTADTGSVTSTMIADGTIVNADVNASAAIAGTKISPDFGSQNVTTTGTVTGASLNPTSSTVPTNGVYLPAANSVAISTNSTGRLFINSSGQVGIGATPAHLLHLTGTTPAMVFTHGTSGTDARVKSNVNGDVVFEADFNNEAADSRIGFEVDGSERMRLDSSGRLGVGTSSPGYALQVNGVSAVVNPFGAFAALQTAGGIGFRWTLSNNGTFQLQRTPDGFANAAIPITVDGSDRVGIGTTLPSTALDVSGELTFSAGGAGWRTAAIKGIDEGGSFRGGMAFYTHPTAGAAGAPTERFRCDSSGRLLVGTSSSSLTAKFVVQARTDDSTGNGAVVVQRGSTPSAANQTLGAVQFTDSSGNYGAWILGESDGGGWTSGSNHRSRLVFSTTADGASSPTERMRISSDGTVRAGTTTNDSFFATRGHIFRDTTATLGQQMFTVDIGSGVPTFSVFYNANTGAPNAANATVKIGLMGVTSRSINAAGTINASGADYAEYMTKNGQFTINKGDICGVAGTGLLTNKFAEAVSFVVKSTNPSYVGGDVWGSAFTNDPEGLEQARQAVDRIAFAGQVPINVIGATAGQYIVPIEAADGGIEGIAKNEVDLTLAEYMRAVGKVIAVEDDGRARIIVKVA